MTQTHHQPSGSAGLPGEPASRAAPAEASDVLALDAHAIQVLAHPLRSRLLGALRVDGPATATALAETLGTNSGATSYHLRKLADVGLVTDTGEGRGRERVWRATTAMHSWTDVAYDDPDTKAAATWLRGNLLRHFVGVAEAWLAVQEDWPTEWRTVAGSDDRVYDMSAARLERMLGEIRDVFERYRLAEPGSPEGERPGDGDVVRLATYLFCYPLVGGTERGS